MAKVINIEQKEQCEVMRGWAEEGLKKQVINWCGWLMMGKFEMIMLKGV